MESLKYREKHNVSTLSNLSMEIKTTQAPLDLNASSDETIPPYNNGIETHMKDCSLANSPYQVEELSRENIAVPDPQIAELNGLEVRDEIVQT